MLLALLAPPSRGGAAAAFRTNALRAPAVSRAPRCKGATAAMVAPRQRFSALAPLSSSSKQSPGEDYNSLKVSELRDLLRDRGLAVSGIKAQLVERLASGKVGRKKAGNKPWKRAALKTAEWEVEGGGGQRVDDRDRRGLGVVGGDDDLDKDLKGLGRMEDDGVDDLAGIVDQLKTWEGRDPNDGEETRRMNYEKEMVKEYNEGVVGKINNEEKRMNDLNRRPLNLVFDEQNDEDDNGWGGDDEDEDEEFEPNRTVGVPQHERQIKRGGKPRYERQSNDRDDKVTFKEDFQGTRVFVQGLPEDATWKNLKDHFKIAGDVVYASVSIDKRTGQSKQCGIVQFETPSMAQYAIREMRNHPMDGETLFVRKDVQESRNGSNSRGRGRDGDGDERYSRNDRDERYSRDNDRSGYTDNLPTEWKRANDPLVDGDGDDWYNLRPDELKDIESLIEKRDKQRRQKNYKMSDQLRDELKDEFGVHLDDRLKLWWTDTQHGGVPGAVSEIKGEGRWGKQKPWRQIPTDPENDAMVDAEYVMGLLQKRDGARRRKDFRTADDLLQRAHDAPRGDLGLRIHDESRTWRIWTERPPPRRGETPAGYEELSPGEMCLQIVTVNEPEKLDEMKSLLKKFPGREWNIFKKLKDRYNAN